MLPAGSEALTPNNILHAFRAMDREAFIYVCDEIDPATKKPKWNKIRPLDAIHRYVDSGIPVMLGLKDGAQIGHAVLATGIVYSQKNLPAAPKNDLTKAFFSDFVLINDDQRGANLWLPVTAANNPQNYPYNIEDNLLYMIIPLPKKVYMTAEKAEIISWDIIKGYVNLWNTNLKTQLTAGKTDTSAGDDFCTAFAANKIIARTYLTFGWKYKNRILNNKIHLDFKSSIIFHDLPKYVWVTEFSIDNKISSLDASQHEVLSHVVIDATSSTYWETVSILHAPGFVMRYQHDPKDQFSAMVTATEVLPNDKAYAPKVRGL